MTAILTFLSVSLLLYPLSCIPSEAACAFLWVASYAASRVAHLWYSHLVPSRFLLTTSILFYLYPRTTSFHKSSLNCAVDRPRARAPFYHARESSPSLALLSLSFALLFLSCHSHCFCPSTRHSCHLCPDLLRVGTHAGQMTHAPMHTYTRGTQSHDLSSCFATAHHSFALPLPD